MKYIGAIGPAWSMQGKYKSLFNPKQVNQSGYRTFDINAYKNTAPIWSFSNQKAKKKTRKFKKSSKKKQTKIPRQNLKIKD